MWDPFPFGEPLLFLQLSIKWPKYREARSKPPYTCVYIYICIRHGRKTLHFPRNVSSRTSYSWFVLHLPFDSFLSRSAKNRGGGSFEDKPSGEGWFDRTRKREEDSWSFAKVNRYWKFNYRARPLAAFVIFNERVLRRDGKRETNPSGWLLTDGIWSWISRASASPLYLDISYLEDYRRVRRGESLRLERRHILLSCKGVPVIRLNSTARFKCCFHASNLSRLFFPRRWKIFS